MRVLAAQLNPTIGDIASNTRKVIEALKRAHKEKADVVLFSELVISGYPPEDLLLDPDFIKACMRSLDEIVPFTKGLFAVVGLPRWNASKREKSLYNSAAVFINGELAGFKNKTLLPTYDVFDERRYFEPGGAEQPTWDYLGWKIAVTICEDAWQHSHSSVYTNYSSDPVRNLIEKRPDLFLNLSASPYAFHKKEKRLAVFQAAAKTLHCPLILCNQVGANDQIVFDGDSLYLNEKGELIQLAKGFEEDDLIVDLETHACACSLAENRIKDLYSALVLGLKDYFRKQGFTSALVGLSGGIDSAVVTCLAVEALGSSHVRALSMPTRFSSRSSYEDALDLASRLRINLEKVEIDSVFQTYLNLLEPFFQGRPHDETEENIQSRVRGMVLMAFSNKYGSLVLNTGNKSEMAMGYTTLYGDMCGAIGVLLDVTKTRVYELAHWINREREVIPLSIINKIPTAELRPNQTDFDTLPRFEILDPVIEEYVEQRLTPQEIAKTRNLPLDFVNGLVNKIHLAEYKRRQAPIGIRVTPKSFSKGRNVPIVQLWKTVNGLIPS